MAESMRTQTPVTQPRTAPAGTTDDSGRTGDDVASMRRSFLDHVRYSRGKNYETSTAHDRFMALSLAVRDRLADRWVKTARTYYEQDVKRAYYLSAEYLLGRALGNNLLSLGMHDAAAGTVLVRR